MIHKFHNGRVILGNTIEDNLNVYTKGDRIICISKEEFLFDIAHDANGYYISPGFIDIHVHGGGGVYFSGGALSNFFIASEVHAKHGTTTLLPTISTATTEDYILMLENVKRAQENNLKGSYMPGVHLEGPYFSPVQCGGQDPKTVRNFDPDEYLSLMEKYGDYILRWSAAPELPGTSAFARAAREHGIKLSIGHSNAEFYEVMRAYDIGFECITHLYSCTSTVHRKNAYRYAGIVEAAYMIDGMDVEIIADGKHLPASLLKFVVKHKGTDRIALVTDAILGAGMPDGAEIDSDIPGSGRKFIIEDGVAKLPDRSAFAGSVAFSNRLVRNMIDMADVPLLEAVRMATANPARIAGLKDRGQIREGAFADIIIFDDDIDVKLTMVNGKVVYI